MKNMMKAFSTSLGILKNDKIIILLSLVPVIVGLAFYYYLGNFFYQDLLSYGNEYITNNVTNENVGGALSWLLTGFITVILFFLVNWTFVLFVSLVASPFNDLISGRVEKAIKGEISDSVDSERFFKKFFKTIMNEAKKISIIILVSIIAFILGFVFPPLSFGVSALLLAISFTDYAWSRKELNTRECIKDVKSSFLTYLVSGCAFMALISIPIFNLIIFPFAVVYYSVIYYSKEQLA